MLPPPNVTGSLHMGHALDHTLMDALTRRKRMQGYEVLWLPGMDHAGIATQTVVEKQLAVDGKTKEDFGRELFIDKVWDWKRESGGTIGGQMRRLGDGVDWSRDRFTMDDGLSRAVQTIFKRLYDAGLIYRAERLVNWSPVLQTAISDIEVKYEDVEGELVSLRYGSLRRRRAAHRGGHHPGRDDARRHRDRRAPRRRALPAPGRHDAAAPVPRPRASSIVADDHVDPEFGTGAVKVTPAHDPNDFEIGLRHNLPMPTIMDTKGRIADTGTHFDGMDRFEARVKVREALAEQGRIVAEKRPYLHSVGHSERSGESIEPRLSLQWWVKVESLAKAAGDAVRNGDTVIHPASLEPRWFAWVDNMHDWCISRQLWWGHRIPIWYGPDGEMVCVGPDETAARGLGAGPRRARHLVLLGAVAVLDDGLARPHRRAREVLSDQRSGHRLRHPVLLGGADDDVRHLRRRRRRDHARRASADRRCRSRTCSCTAWSATSSARRCPSREGNGIDPLDWVEQFGADALRFTLARGANPGGDLSIGEDHAQRVAQLRHQAVQRHQVRADERRRAGAAAGRRPSSPTPTAGSSAGSKRFAPRWIRRSTATSSARRARRCTTSPGTSSATGTSSWPRCSSPKEQVEHTTAVLATVLDALLRLLHPVMPFVTETLWKALTGGESLVIADWPQPSGSRWIRLPRNASRTCRSWSPRCAGSAATRA